MRIISTIFIIILLMFPVFGVNAGDNDELKDRLSGRILIQVESYGRAWYVYPEDKTRYYLQNGSEAFNIMRNLGLGISNHDLEKIPKKDWETGDTQLVERLKGYILLQVEEHGEAWYVNPVDGLRYYMKDGEAAYNMMREMGLGISNINLGKVPMNGFQIAFDSAFNSVAYTSYYNDEFEESSFGDTILPLASLTKLMTALVLLDLNPDWDQVVTITEDQINYPYYYVGDDPTSEIDLQAGDQVKIEDLWVALLVSSSNQSAAVLVDSTGYSRDEFVKLMNQKVEELDLKKSHFVDVAGLDAHNVSTANEMALIAKAAFSNSKIADTAKITEYIIQARTSDDEERSINVINRNRSLLEFEPDCAKTGFLVEAQRNVALQKDGRVIVILHARSMYERNTILDMILN